MLADAPGWNLADAVLPRRHTLVRDLALILVFGTLMSAFARVAVYLPFTPVPITGQTLGVLLTGALLGRVRGSLAMLAYLAEGLAGLPVFAGGHNAWTIGPPGVAEIIGPSAGYLWSYPIAAGLVGWLADRGWDRTFARSVLAMLAGEVAIYAVGLPWLAWYIGAAAALPAGLLPFIPGDVLKLLLAAAVLPSGWRLVSAFQGKPAG